MNKSIKFIGYPKVKHLEFTFHWDNSLLANDEISQRINFMDYAQTHTIKVLKASSYFYEYKEVTTLAELCNNTNSLLEKYICIYKQEEENNKNTVCIILQFEDPLQINLDIINTFEDVGSPFELKPYSSSIQKCGKIQVYLISKQT